MPPKPDVKYEELVRVRMGYAPARETPLPGASRNRARLIVWKTYKVEMDHSRDNGHFRVKFLHSRAHCCEYLRNPEEDQEEFLEEPDSYFEELCGCGAVHDGSGHDTAESEGAGAVYNVPPQEQHKAQLPQQDYVAAAGAAVVDHDGDDPDHDGDDRDTWQQPEDEDLDLWVMQQTGGQRPLLFLTDDMTSISSYVESVVLRFSADGLERHGPSVKLEYASDHWLRYVNGELDDQPPPDSSEAESHDAEAMDAEDSADDAELPDAEDAEDPEEAAAAALADSFWASTPTYDAMDEDPNHDPDYGDEDSASSDESTGHSWYNAHSDRILHLLSEWLDRMNREHGLLGRTRIIAAPHPPHIVHFPEHWYRPLPGLVRPVADPVRYRSSERPLMSPNMHTLRAREEGRHKLLGGWTGTRHLYHTKKEKWRTGQRLAPACAPADQNVRNVYLVSTAAPIVDTPIRNRQLHFEFDGWSSHNDGTTCQELIKGVQDWLALPSDSPQRLAVRRRLQERVRAIVDEVFRLDEADELNMRINDWRQIQFRIDAINARSEDDDEFTKEIVATSADGVHRLRVRILRYYGDDEYDPDRELDDGRRMLEVRYDGPHRFETYYDYDPECSEGGRVQAV
jgi:hypothetical protein